MKRMPIIINGPGFPLLDPLGQMNVHTRTTIVMIKECIAKITSK